MSPPRNSAALRSLPTNSGIDRHRRREPRPAPIAVAAPAMPVYAISALTCDFAEINARSTVCVVGQRDGIRALCSVPAMSLRAVAARLGIADYQLRLAVAQLEGRGRCDQLAATATARLRREVLQATSCPPFVARRAGWDEPRFVRRSIPGVAGWASRGVNDPAAPRVAHAKAAADPSSRPTAARQSGCPQAIAMRLVADDRPTGQYLAATTPHPAVIAALATAGDNDARAVAAGRDDRPAALTESASLRIGPSREGRRDSARYPRRTSRYAARGVVRWLRRAARAFTMLNSR